MNWRTGIPPIGQSVFVQSNGGYHTDYMRQARLGDEQFVLIWGWSENRYSKSDLWCPFYITQKGTLGYL